ncbi:MULTISPECIES: DUF350 domain-containing protein [Gordonia]|uniref:DUF350 domain-containing protein n=1 Tax=Gordonia amicalis TaxID=89053 RepID=A0AAE4R6A8_9ACTN|nr:MULTISPECIES: DUF350 domain-containing protein [Gordonia]ATD69389.1 DUF350 domain-containing protein [Gordonia sp. 1D]MBA5845758.1 DUF350 domain-containing protein [Gordonia amicalis]MCR8898101.1 DUF350 domain-containing protein [Gordonia sp. GONU]MCZ0911349.1 DUF350 domain-containing protein [Gordonia amicalis]MCZ4581736.1 DUF350 domain-containing protein [Gordonia amicalis]
MELLRDNLAAGASFSLVGIALLVLGFVALDLVTPGRLRQLVWVDHNRNAVILTTSMVIGLSIVLACSVVDTELLALWRALLYTAAYVVLTIAVMMWSFVLIDWLTPGKLGTLLLENDEHPAGWITAAVFVGIGAVIGITLLV